ncbi:MAG: hypothetical protein WEC84_00245, partial [Candidatus Andersenbacteria bacterium]
MAATRSLNSAYIALSGAILIGVAIIFLLIRPLLSEIDITQAAIDTKEVELAEREGFLQTIDLKIAALRTQEEHEARLQVMLPAEERMEDALRILHEAAAGSGLVIDRASNVSAGLRSRFNAASARGEAIALPSKVQPLGFSLNVSASYQQLRAFLTSLERSPRLMDVLNISLDTAELVDTLGGQMEVIFYMQEAEKTL